VAFSCAPGTTRTRDLGIRRTSLREEPPGEMVSWNVWIACAELFSTLAGTATVRGRFALGTPLDAAVAPRRDTRGAVSYAVGFGVTLTPTPSCAAGVTDTTCYPYNMIRLANLCMVGSDVERILLCWGEPGFNRNAA
jgi:hypothetical protein